MIRTGFSPNESERKRLLWLLTVLAVSLVAGGPLVGFRCDAIAFQSPDKRWSQPSTALPFTVSDISDYFADALMRKPVQGRGGVVSFEDDGGAHPEQRYRIAIFQEGADVVVVFTIAGDYGMNQAREFFESPLFDREESERFYSMLSRAEKAPIEILRRFTVAVDLAETGDLVQLTLRFSPNRITSNRGAGPLSSTSQKGEL